MKTTILISAFLLFLVGCSNDEVNYITIKGRVEREVNGEGISNQIVLLEMQQNHGSGFWSYTTIVDSKTVTTDSNGNFNTSMKTDSNTFVSVAKLQDNNYTAFGLKNFYPNEDIIVRVNKFIKFKIFVNNTNPFDLNDYIYVDFFSGLNQNFRTNVENLGTPNIHHPEEHLPGGGVIGAFDETSWIGTNINSIVYYNVPENADKYNITWIKRKNGVETNGFTNEIPFIIDQINEYHFNY